LLKKGGKIGFTSRCRKTHAVPSVTKMQVAERRSSRPFAKAAFMPSKQPRLHDKNNVATEWGRRIGIGGKGSKAAAMVATERALLDTLVVQKQYPLRKMLSLTPHYWC